MNETLTHSPPKFLIAALPLLLALAGPAGDPEVDAEAILLAEAAEAAAAAEVAQNDPTFDAVLAHVLNYERRSRLTRPELEVLTRTIIEEAARYDLEPELVLAVMHVESRFNAFAVSPADALGLMQLLPSTGEWMAARVGVEWKGPQTLFDPVANTRLGVAYLRLLMDRYDGNVRTALLAYNWGPGRIDRRLRTGTPLPREYAQLVFAAFQPSS